MCKRTLECKIFLHMMHISVSQTLSGFFCRMHQFWFRRKWHHVPWCGKSIDNTLVCRLKKIWRPFVWNLRLGIWPKSAITEMLWKISSQFLTKQLLNYMEMCFLYITIQCQRNLGFVWRNPSLWDRINNNIHVFVSPTNLQMRMFKI